MRKHLRERLPDYMVPTAFVKMERLPLTPNGKVDRKALPAYKAEGGAAATVGRQASEVERVVAGIWKEVLGVEEVGIEDNFFEVGGHSLLATQVMARVREAFGVEMELRRMFEAATVADLSLLIEKALQEDRGLLAPPIHRFPRDGDLPLSFSQQRLWFLDQLEPDSALYNIASAARLKGPLNIPVMVQSLSEITRRHEALRTIFKSDTGRPVQVILPPAPLDVPLVDLSRLPEDQIEIELMRIATEEAQRPFTLSEGLLIRGTLVRLGELDHAALVTMHHIVSDGWSMGIFIRELAALYQAFSAGEPSPLPELPIQYADFAQWQHQWLQGEALEKQLSYWKEQLEGAPPLLEMPTDRPRPVMQTFRGQTQSLALSENLTRMLIELSQRENATLFMVVLAAFQALVFRYSHQQDIVIGTPIAGRRYVGTESLIGFFVNTLTMRAKLSAEITFRDLLKQVRETALAAYAHQDLPFEKLVEELVPGRDLSRSPIVQAMFVLQNLPAGPPQPGRARAQPLAARHGRLDVRPDDVRLAVGPAPDGLAAVQHGPVRGGHCLQASAPLRGAIGVSRLCPVARRRPARHAQ